MASVDTGGGRRGKRRLNSEMNVVPYIDVMLVLMIIFMVTAPLLTQGIDVELPQTDGQQMAEGEEPVTLTVDKDGNFYLTIGENHDEALPSEEVVRMAHAVIANKPQEMFLVEADAMASYQDVAPAMSLLQAAGVSKIGFVTDPIQTEP